MDWMFDLDLVSKAKVSPESITPLALVPQSSGAHSPLPSCDLLGQSLNRAVSLGRIYVQATSYLPGGPE